MTNGDMPELRRRLDLMQRRNDQIASQLTTLAEQVEGIRGSMVTRKEHQDAYEPLARMVKDHDVPYRWGKKYWNRLAWIGLASIWLSPHVVPIVRDATKWLQSLVK